MSLLTMSMFDYVTLRTSYITKTNSNGCTRFWKNEKKYANEEDYMKEKKIYYYVKFTGQYMYINIVYTYALSCK